MPSKRLSDAQLLQYLQNRAKTLAGMIDNKVPPVVLADQVSMIVSMAKLVCGAEIIDNKITEDWDKTKLKEEGICIECRVRPAFQNKIICTECLEESVKQGVIDDFESDQDDVGPHKH
jgi:hypothetical protein